MRSVERAVVRPIRSSRRIEVIEPRAFGVCGCILTAEMSEEVNQAMPSDSALEEKGIFTPEGPRSLCSFRFLHLDLNLKARRR